jgi:signal transduction histidine kinase
MDLERVTAERLRFMAGVAHDIRTPLSSLMLSLETLDEHSQEVGDETVKRLMPRMMRCVDLIRMLAMDVMNYYRTETGQFKLERVACDLPELIREIETIAIPLAEEKDVHLTIVPVPEMTIHADRGTLIQILLNLLTNAIKYTDRNGAVLLQVYDLSEGRYQIPMHHYPPVLALPNMGVVFEVADTGRGIALEHYERVFSEFDRLNAEDRQDKDGVGLGLPVSQRLIRLHGGEIWFDSMVNEGSNFAFFLPLGG